MSAPLMPKATALWLIKNTTLSFKQIADFCAMHILEVQNLADYTPHGQLIPLDPVFAGQVTLDEIRKCEADPGLNLHSRPAAVITQKRKTKYIPLAQRSDKPSAIAWILKHHPNIPDRAICTLLSTTKTMVQSIQDKTYKGMANVNPKNPVALMLCTTEELDELVQLYPDEG